MYVKRYKIETVFFTQRFRFLCYNINTIKLLNMEVLAWPTQSVLSEKEVFDIEHSPKSL